MKPAYAKPKKPWPEANCEAAQPFKDAVEALHGKAKQPKEFVYKITAIPKGWQSFDDGWGSGKMLTGAFPKSFMDQWDEFMAFGTVQISATADSFFPAAQPVSYALPGCGETTLHTAKPIPDAAFRSLCDAGRLFDTEMDLIVLARTEAA